MRYLPGLSLAVAVALAALGAEALEVAFFGRAWVDAVVIAILGGTAVHTLAGLPDRAAAGVDLAARFVLEVAIVLLGASVSLATIARTGASLSIAVCLFVALSVATSFAIGRLVGLPHRLALLVACGNSICGNSAIVAAAPVIRAEPEEVAASIAFTAALGVVVVLLLPLAFTLFGLSQWQYGVVAGLTVYAVPQVLAATLPVGAVSVQVGTVVKLMRVLMLAPVMVGLGFGRDRTRGGRPGLGRIIPWFILGFLAMAAIASAELIPDRLSGFLAHASTLLTIVAMAGLGLAVDLRTVLASGGRVLAAGILSLAALAAMSGGLLFLLPGP